MTPKMHSILALILILLLTPYLHAEIEVFLGDRKILVNESNGAQVLQKAQQSPKKTTPNHSKSAQQLDAGITITHKDHSSTLHKRRQTKHSDLSPPKKLGQYIYLSHTPKKTKRKVRKFYPRKKQYKKKTYSIQDTKPLLNNPKSINSIFQEYYNTSGFQQALNQLNFRGNQRIITAQRNLTPHKSALTRIIKSHRLPEELLAIGFVESVYKVDALSASSAAGMWQISIDKAETIINNNPHNVLNDPKLSTQVACKYLHLLSQQFNGDWATVIAAYHLGGNYTHLLSKKAGSSQYKDLEEYLDDETKEYVMNVMAASLLLKSRVI